MSGFLYRRRLGATERGAEPLGSRPMMDFSSGEMEKSPPQQLHSLREFEQHLNDLKKENFSLKLRIYFLEEKIQLKFEESDGDGVHRTNIELKVQVESLKKELEEKQQLLDGAVSAAELLANQREAEVQRCLQERQEDISHVQEVLEAKEAELAQGGARRLEQLAHSEAQEQPVMTVVEPLERTEEESRRRPLLAAASRDVAIEGLTQQRGVLVQVDELQAQLDHLQPSPLGEQKAGRPIRDQLGVCESATLLAKIRDSESRNQELQQRLTHMKLQLQSAQDEAQQHQRDIQNLSNTLSSKEAQAAELSAVIEKQNVSLLSLKQLQVCSAETPSGRSELLDLEVALFQSQLELQAVQRTQRRAERTHGDLRAALQHLEHDLQGALDHRRATERHNRELQQALQKSQALLQERDERLQWCEQAQQQRSEKLEAIVRALRASLHSKDQLIQNWELLELEEPQETRDSLLQKLRQRIRERDRALERAVDDRFRCLEGREEEQRQLHLLLRDRERDLERQRCVLANNQETIASLELLLRGRSLELQQVRQGIQQQQQQLEEGGRSCSRGCCALIGQLQEAVQTSAQEAQGLRSALLAAVQPTPSDVLEELRSRLQLKDRLLQEVLSDCARQAQDHQEQVEELQRTISSRDQYIQDSAARLGEVMSEQSARVQELQRQLSFTRGSAGSGGPDQALELQALQEELKLVLRREKENQEIQSRKLQLKEEMILELQRLLVEPSAVPLVEQLSLEVQELRESLVQQGGRRTLEVPNQDQGLDLVQQDLLREPALHQQPELGGPSSQDQDLDPGPGDQDLDENSSQEMTQTHMRKAVLSLQEENRSLKQELSEQREEEQEEELDVTLKGAEETEQEICEQWDTWEGESSLQPEDHKPPSQNQVEQQAAQQVEQQDQGYETCGRSENEAERDDASSPEFDDLEMCTSLDCDPQWWPPPPVTAGGSTPCRSSAPQREPASLQRLVEELRSQLRGSQAVIHGLRSRLRCSAAPPRVSWSHAQEEEQEEQQQQQQQQQQQDQGLMELLLSRVEALEEQLRSPAADRKSFSLDRKSSGGPGKLDVLIQSQARELSQLRQRQRQARGLSVVLAQQLSDATKAFEELLRSNDVDFLSARSFRQQLAHSAALLERLGARLGTHEDYPEDPEDKTELLAIRLSRELQQKDQVIQSLRSKLNQQQQLDSALSQHSDTPCSSHAPSDITDQSDRISYVSDEHDSVGEEPEVGGIAADCLSRSCYSPEGQSGAQSWISSPSMPCNAEPPRAADGLTGGSSPLSTPFQPLHSFSSVSFQGLHPTPLTPPPPGLLDSSALWDVTYGGRLGAQLGGSLGYQSGTSHTGDLMREHLSEVRMLRQRLEASIITNDRLRLQLQQKVEAEPPFTDRGGATNIYIQGLDSVGQLSAELRILKEEKISLQQQLEETSREGARQVEQMREAVELQHSRLKEAEIQCDRWAEQHKKLQADDAALRQEVALLKQERQKNHEAINRLQHQLTVVPQQLCESRSLVQRELQVHLPHKGGSTASWDLGQLEQQLSGGPPPSSRRLFSDDVPSPPVRDTAPVATEHHRRHLMALQQHIQQGGALLHRMQLNLRSVDPEQDSHLYQLLADAEALRGILCEADLLFRTSWRDDDDSQQKEAEGSGQGAKSLKQEVASLRRKLWQQEQDLGKALEKLRSSDRTKESLEHFVLGQLSRTRDVLKKAKNNLQLRTGEDSSGSATPPPPLLVGVL